MRNGVYRYRFAKSVPVPEIETSLLLALLATEGLYGESQVRLDAAHHLDSEHRVCVIDASTSVGRALNKLFVAFLRREYGEDAFHVRRISKPPAAAA